jgi:hypothetical protein
VSESVKHEDIAKHHGAASGLQSFIDEIRIAMPVETEAVEAVETETVATAEGTDNRCSLP